MHDSNESLFFVATFFCCVQYTLHCLSLYITKKKNCDNCDCRCEFAYYMQSVFVHAIRQWARHDAFRLDNMPGGDKTHIQRITQIHSRIFSIRTYCLWFRIVPNSIYTVIMICFCFAFDPCICFSFISFYFRRKKKHSRGLPK